MNNLKDIKIMGNQIKENNEDSKIYKEDQKNKENVNTIIKENNEDSKIYKEDQKNKENVNTIIKENNEDSKIYKEDQKNKENVNIYIKYLEKKIKKFSKRIKENNLRFQAELDNIYKRNELEIEKIYKFSLENFLKELIPVIDNLERAIESTDKSNPILATTLEGIELTLKSLLNVIKKFGVKIISKTFIPFDPKIHQAITILKSQDYESNYILEIIQKGYSLNNRLLRPALVVVSKN